MADSAAYMSFTLEHRQYNSYTPLTFQIYDNLSPLYVYVTNKKLFVECSSKTRKF